MAATAWAIYNEAKFYIGRGDIKLGVDNFKVMLLGSASNTSTYGLSVSSELTGECANANGYVTGGKALPSPTWAVGASAKQYLFSGTNPVWSAAGGAIANIKYAAIRNSTGAGVGKLLAWSRLSATQFTLASGNFMTLNVATNGIFQLV